MTLSTAGLIIGWLVALAGAVSTLGALRKVGAEREKIAAEAKRAGVDSAKVLTDTAMDLLAEQTKYLRAELAAAREEITQLPSRAQVARLQTDLAAARTEITQLRAEIAGLRGLAPGLERIEQQQTGGG